MRGAGFVAIAAIVATVAFVACAGPAVQDSAEIRSLAEGWEAALNSGDLDSLMALYSEQSRLLPPNGEMAQGLAAVEGAFGGMIEAGLRGELETLEAMAAGDLGHRVGTYVLRSAEGDVVDRGKYIETWSRDDGSWKITNDIWNSDMPVPMEASTTLAITHQVEDGSHWLAAWQGENGRHALFAEHGAPRVRVFQSPDDANLTGLVVEVEDMEAFQAMLASEEGAAAAAADGVDLAKMSVLREVK